MRTAFKALLAFVAAVAIIVGLIYLSGGISMLTAPFRGEVAEKEITEADGNYRISAYEEFYDNNARVEALNTQICTMKANTSLPDEQRETNVLALTNTRTDLVNEYNADARKTDTRAKFKASDLPYELPAEAPPCN